MKYIVKIQMFRCFSFNMFNISQPWVSGTVDTDPVDMAGVRWRSYTVLKTSEDALSLWRLSQPRRTLETQGSGSQEDAPEAEEVPSACGTPGGAGGALLCLLLHGRRPEKNLEPAQLERPGLGRTLCVFQEPSW